MLCTICWRPICEVDGLTYSSGAYFCEKTGDWICKKCYLDFRQRFRWTCENEKL